MKMFKGNYPNRPPKSLTKQQIFDTVCDHLKLQNKKAVDVITNTCTYRTKDGLALAVGCLMTDTEAVVIVGTVYNLVRCHRLPKRFMGYVNFLGELQDIHDHYKPSRWAQKLRVLGKSYELDISKAKW